MSALLLQYVRPIPVLVGLSILLNCALWVLALFFFPKDSPAAVLHYSVGVGIDFIGPGRQILRLPAVGSSLLLLNIILARLVARASQGAYWIFIGSIPIVQLILIVAFILIWRLN